MPKLPGIDYPTINPINGPLTINTNQVTPAVLFSYGWNTAQNVVIEYSLVRGLITEVGRIMISTDGTGVSFSVDRTDKQAIGITLFPVLNGSLIEVQYNSDNSGGNANFWYAQRNLYR